MLRRKASLTHLLGPAEGMFETSKPVPPVRFQLFMGFLSPLDSDDFGEIGDH
ncbi:hypothetical protein PGTUg99_023164 [Puccinia graminis f. sp. tritici]|uniref:Uncharacterized protein n=1 Tax=Puccinia graminis f. sp. tritici TaxID=56615 RepID=A0A5B0S7W8_PUCGR|nr:hypothetical protein PGTUg99_023164 [Puccinia graminis f. sp. tritici]